MPDQNTILPGEPIGLRDVRIAAWNPDGTYGENIRLYGVTDITVTLNTTGAQRWGDGNRRLAGVRFRNGMTFAVTFAGDISTLTELVGALTTTTGVTPNRIRGMVIGAGAMPYVGITGSLDLDSGQQHQFHFFAPKAQVSSDDITILTGTGGETPEFGTLEVELMTYDDPAWIVQGENEVQTLTVGGTPTAGTFQLRYGNATTSALAYNADASAIEAALEAIPAIGSGNVTVTLDSGDFVIEFSDNLGRRPIWVMGVIPDSSFDGTLEIERTVIGTEDVNNAGGIYELESPTIPALPPLFPTDDS